MKNIKEFTGLSEKKDFDLILLQKFLDDSKNKTFSDSEVFKELEKFDGEFLYNILNVSPVRFLDVKNVKGEKCEIRPMIEDPETGKLYTFNSVDGKNAVLKLIKNLSDYHQISALEVLKIILDSHNESFSNKMIENKKYSNSYKKIGKITGIVFLSLLAAIGSYNYISDSDNQIDENNSSKKVKELSSNPNEEIIKKLADKIVYPIDQNEKKESDKNISNYDKNDISSILKEVNDKVYNKENTEEKDDKPEEEIKKEIINIDSKFPGEGNNSEIKIEGEKKLNSLYKEFKNNFNKRDVISDEYYNLILKNYKKGIQKLYNSGNTDSPEINVKTLFPSEDGSLKSSISKHADFIVKIRTLGKNFSFKEIRGSSVEVYKKELNDL